MDGVCGGEWEWRVCVCVGVESVCVGGAALVSLSSFPVFLSPSLLAPAGYATCRASDRVS